MILRMLLVGAIACLASTSSADFVINGNGGGAIPDDGSLVTTSNNITQDETITGLDVCIDDLEHTWVGDLVVTLTHVSTGTVVPLFNRVDRFGTTGPGDSSNLDGNYEFSDAGADFWSEAANGTSSYSLIPAAYRASDVGGNPISLDNAFAGESTTGVWRLSITDADAKEVGSFSGWSIKFRSNAVPEPTSLGLLALFGGAAMLGRRRR